MLGDHPVGPRLKLDRALLGLLTQLNRHGCHEFGVHGVHGSRSNAAILQDPVGPVHQPLERSVVFFEDINPAFVEYDVVAGRFLGKLGDRRFSQLSRTVALPVTEPSDSAFVYDVIALLHLGCFGRRFFKKVGAKRIAVSFEFLSG